MSCGAAAAKPLFDIMMEYEAYEEQPEGMQVDEDLDEIPVTQEDAWAVIR